MKKSTLYGLVLCLNLLIADVAISAEVTIAVIAPKAGENVSSGQELFKGAELAVNELNANGGLLKQKLDLLTIDDRCDDRLAISTAEMLTLLNSKKVVLVIGPYCTNRYEETSNIYKNAQIFQIIPTAAALHGGDDEAKEQFTLLNNKAQMSADFFAFYNQNFAGLKVGFVYDNTISNGYEETAKELYNAFKRYGKSDRLKFYPYTAQSETSDLAQAFLRDDINLLLISGLAEDTANIIYSAKQQNKNILIFSAKKNLTTKLIDNLGKKANGLYAMELADIKDSLLFTESLVDLRLLGIEPEGLEAYSYAAIKLWGELVKQAKTFDYATLTSTVVKPKLQEKWQAFLIHSGKSRSAKYVIEMYKDNDFKQVY